MTDTKPTRRRAGDNHRFWLVPTVRLWRNWGTTAAEEAVTLPGDELVREPAETYTMAVTVDAAAADVWRWLVQIGQDRGGMYRYDRLESIFGVRIHPTAHIDARWQHLRVGDKVRLVRRHWLDMHDAAVLAVALLEPGRSVVLYQRPPEYPWNSIWSFHVLPLDWERCRLLSRNRATLPVRPNGLAPEAKWPMSFVSTRNVLLGIKQRAERSYEEPVSVSSTQIHRRPP